MNNAIYLKAYSAPPLSRKEILRYARTYANGDLEQRLEALIDECRPLLTYRVCYRRFPFSVKDSILDLSFAKSDSKDLMKNLEGCCEFILFAATVGIPFDRVLAKYSRLSPADALLMQAIGTERIEALANHFEDDIKASLHAEGMGLCPRFSPGYGDLPLSLQVDIFNTLNCSKNLGISLNPQMLMTPSKSITAIIGLKEIK